MQLLLLATLATLIPGQLVRLNFIQNAAITLSDLSVFTIVSLFFLRHLIARKPINIPTQLIYFALFAGWAVISLVYALNNLGSREVVISSLFLIRFVFYALFSVVVAKLVKGKLKQWTDALVLVGVVFAIFGLIQFFLIPDLRTLQLHGWDPHIYRLFSTLFDPNYAGGILVNLLCFSLALYFFTKERIYTLISAFFLICTVITFSRSSYLALVTAFVVIGFLKSPRLLLILLAVFILSFASSSYFRIRVIGAFTYDETSRARVESWQRALQIFKTSPVFGVGFNTYRYSQASLGYFSVDSPLGGHSGAGADSSMLTVLATTGIVGIVLFILYILQLIKLALKDINKNYINLAFGSLLAATLVHSQFVNSLFFPQTMLIIYFALGLRFANDN